MLTLTLHLQCMLLIRRGCQN